MIFEELFGVGLEVVWKIGPIPCLESCEIYYPGWDSGRGSANIKSESHYRSERNQFSCKFKQVSDSEYKTEKIS